MAAAVLGICCGYGTVAWADSDADMEKEAMGLLKLARQNNGKAFCAPASTTMKDLMSAVTCYTHARPELHGEFTDRQFIEALVESYPCPATSDGSPADADAIKN